MGRADHPNTSPACAQLSRLLPFAPGEGIAREVYLRFHDNLVDVLLPKASEEQRRALQARDWAVDSGGADTLSYDRFAKAMFELTDQWTTSVDPAEYKAFVDALRFRLSKAGTK